MKKDAGMREKAVTKNCEAKTLADELLKIARDDPDPDAWKKLTFEFQKAAFKVFVLKFENRGN